MLLPNYKTVALPLLNQFFWLLHKNPLKEFSMFQSNFPVFTSKLLLSSNQNKFFSCHRVSHELWKLPNYQTVALPSTESIFWMLDRKSTKEFPHLAIGFNLFSIIVLSTELWRLPFDKSVAFPALNKSSECLMKTS